MAKDLKGIVYRDRGISWEIFPAVCKSCGLCIEHCPIHCLSFDINNIEYLGMPTVKCDVKKCIACHTCELNCPDCAIEVRGKR